MYYTIGPGSSLYRVTSDKIDWPNPVLGQGAFFMSATGNRYNAPHQSTVSCAEDPFVAHCEAAYYQALEWQRLLGQSHINPLHYPLLSSHLFWRFRIDPYPAVIDINDPITRSRFGYQPHRLLNPAREYVATQNLADNIRSYMPPTGSKQAKPEGLRAPSVRTPGTHGYQPYQLALFVLPEPVGIPYDQRSELVSVWRLEFEFLDRASPYGSVNFDTPGIDWGRPKFRLSQSERGPMLDSVPAFSDRPAGKEIRVNRWLRLQINFS